MKVKIYAENINLGNSNIHCPKYLSQMMIGRVVSNINNSQI